MGKGSRPTASMLKERRQKRIVYAENNESTSIVELDRSQIDVEYLNKFIGKIFFGSYTIRKISSPNIRTSRFSVSTKRHIRARKLIPLVEGAFPRGSKVTLSRGYKYLHEFNVKTAASLRWDEFIWRIVKALEDVL